MALLLPSPVVVDSDVQKNFELIRSNVASDVDLATLQAEVDAHEAETTTAHGGIVASTDPRLTDQRVPTNDSVTLAKINTALKGTPAGSVEALRKLGTASTEACAGNDARLSDERTPINGSVTAAKAASVSGTGAFALVDSPAFTGNPTVPTASGSDSDTSAASTAMVQAALGIYLPVGSLVMWATGSAPTGWLLCDGASLLRAGTYAALFAVISTTYGSVDGTHFTLPDLRGKVPIGVSGGHALASTGGEETHVLSIAEMPTHHHSAVSVGGSGAIQAGAGYTTISQNTGDTGGDGAHNNLQPFLTINYVIKF